MKTTLLITSFLIIISVGVFAQKPFRYIDKFDQNQAYLLENIYFDLGRWDIKPESKAALDSLLNFLKRNENLVVEIGNHKSTYISTGQMCMILTQKRSQNVVEYLIENGIDANRVVAKGYEETTPYVVPEDTKHFKKGTVMTDQYIEKIKDENIKLLAIQLNRRTQIKILRNDYVPTQ